MAKRDPDHAHDINRLNMWFALSSIVMFIFFMWTMWQDFGRPWKKYQAEFRRLDLAKTRVAAAMEQQTLASNPEFQRVVQELQAADAQLKQQRAEQQKALEEQADFQGTWYNADQKFRFAKAEFEAKRYDYEEAVAEHPKEAPDRKKDLDETVQEMERYSAELDKINAQKAQIDARVEQFTKRSAELEKERSRLASKLDRFIRKEENISPSIANVFRNLPIVDFIDPSIKIQQVVVNNLYEDLNFLAVQRVDRCMTCHVAIAQEGYEEGTEIPGYGKIVQPYASHPNLDLYVGSNSKHPMDSFGCTGCHAGRGRSTDFTGVVHIPGNEKQKKEWEEKYHWHKLHHWDFPMYKSDMTEASCTKCHAGAAQIAQGKRINASRALFIDNGCHGCHLTRGYENIPKVGPDLRHVGSKVTKDWAFKWIKNPRGFRPTTRMPHYFGNSNNNSPEDIARGDVETRALVEFLFSKSTPIEYPAVNISGNAETGKQLVTDLGCVGCHLLQGEAKPRHIDSRRRFGPALDKLGSKTTASWIYHWIREPKHYAPKTRMPNMKLTEQEAMDITSYLVSLRDMAWEQESVPPMQEKYLKEEILHYMKRTLGLGAEQEYNRMTPEQRWVFLGQKTMERYGCTGCHLVDGYENAKGIGTALTEEGSKILTKFDFGFVHIEHSVDAWISQKIHEPRIYDKDRVKRWDEKLMMPNFGFSEAETEALTMLIMGMTKEVVPVEAQDRLTAQEQIAERGRWLAMEKNCVACHNIDGWGGEIKEVITEEGMAPPALIGEGEKVHSDWLFQFLKNPGSIRPWIKVRMPNFRLTDEEANILVQYFMSSANVGPFNAPPDIHENLAEGQMVFNLFQCSSCHVVAGEVPAGKTAADLAPDLTLTQTRLRADWIVKWLDDPQKLLPGTRMPDFFPEAAVPNVLEGSSEKQRIAIRNYLYSIGKGNQASIAPLENRDPVAKTEPAPAQATAAPGASSASSQ